MPLLQSIEDKQFAANVKMLRQQNEELTKAINELKEEMKILVSTIAELKK